MRLGMGSCLIACLAMSACRSGADRSAWTVSIRGFGPVEAGMTLAEANAAGARALRAPHPGSESCDMVGFADDTGSAVSFMVVGGRIARVDITGSPVETNHGARIGDAESRIQQLYPGRVTVRPHKYTAGHYLIVAPSTPADSGFELVFETDSRRVTRYRAGKLPAVEYVEGCS